MVEPHWLIYVYISWSGPQQSFAPASNVALLIVKALLALSIIGSAHYAADTTDCGLVRPYGAQKLNDKRLQ
jgi:hypothetical protein